MNTRKEAMQAELQLMLSDLVPLINAAADKGNFHELKSLVERRNALRRILDHCTVDA